MKVPVYNLPQIAQILRKNRKFILTIMILCAVLAAVIYFLKPKMYKTKAEFIAYNALYTDRQNIFRLDEARYIGYFAGESEMDRIIAIVESGVLQDRVINELNLATVYPGLKNKKDTLKKKASRKIFNSSYRMAITDNLTMSLSYVAPDSVLAMNVVNKILTVMEEEYKNYINSMSNHILEALGHKIGETDSVIAIMTDSLVKLRDHYQIYDLINPARQNIINGSFKNNGVPGFARGLEEIQHIEAIKDQMVKDRAAYTSLYNEHSTGRDLNQMPLIHMITYPESEVEEYGMKLFFTLLSAILLGGFFSAVFVLFRNAFQHK